MIPSTWRIRREFPAGTAPWLHLAKEAGISSSAARLAWLRGDENTEALGWRLDPSWTRPYDPFLMQGMSTAVASIRKALADRTRVLIYGDYDVDGVTATAILVRALERMGGTPEFFIPNRFQDGYGLNLECLKELASGGPGLFISVDCGVRSIDEVAASRELGLRWIITDHHALASELPAAEAVLHPALGGYPNPQLTGVGVAFKLAQALLDAVPIPQGADATFLDGLLKLVALGTVADVAPLRGENAWLVKRGLRSLGGANGPGLSALLTHARIEGVPRAGDLAFGVVPRLNAMGRMEEAEGAVRLLLSRSPAEAQGLAARAEVLNDTRKQVQAALLQRLPPPDASAFELLLEPEAHKGVLGIVAGQRMRRTGRPTAIGTVSDGLAQCSLRAPGGYDLTLMLERASPWLRSGGGHANAAGITFLASHTPFVRKAMTCAAEEQAAHAEQLPLCLDGTDAEEAPTAQDLAFLEPFGAAYPEPLFPFQGAMRSCKPFGQGHLRLSLEGCPEPFTWFGGAETPEAQGGCLHLAAAPQDHPRWGRSWRVEAALPVGVE